MTVFVDHNEVETGIIGERWYPFARSKRIADGKKKKMQISS